MDDGFSLQLPEPGLELIDLPHFFQQQLRIRRSAGVGGIQQLAQFPETDVDAGAEIRDLSLPLGGVRQPFRAQPHGTDGVPRQSFHLGPIRFTAMFHE